jgi:P27 family predicted phage terminase small subunit
VTADGEPVRPDWLEGLARDLWDSITPGLVATGVAKARDTVALIGMCEWWALYRRLMDALSSEDVSPKLAPLAAQAGIAWDKFSQMASKFGMTPSDRAKLRVEMPQKGGVQSRRRAT